MSRGDKTGEDRIEKIVLRIQRTYLALAILGFLSALSSIFGQPSLRDISEDFVFMLVYVLVYFGLRRRRSWVIPLILITSAFACIGFLIGILQPAVDVMMVLSKILIVLLFLFFAYQIVFFRKPEVRLFFGAKGQELF